jgi:hypothetical protein
MTDNFDDWSVDDFDDWELMDSVYSRYGRPTPRHFIGGRWYDWGYASVKRASYGKVVERPWLAANVLERLRREKSLMRKMHRRKRTRQRKRGYQLHGVAVIHGALSAYELDKVVTAWTYARTHGVRD